MDQRIVIALNSLPQEIVDFGSLRSFKGTVKVVNFPSFPKCFSHSNVVFLLM